MRKAGFLISAAFVLAACASVSADILWHQPYDGASPQVTSQKYTDAIAQSVYLFDDFFVGSGGWTVNRVTVYGLETGSSAANAGVFLKLSAIAGINAPGQVFTGTQVGNNLVFNLPDVYLTPSYQWLTAFVERPMSGGSWRWNTTTPITVNQFVVHNPGGGLGLGTSPVLGSKLPQLAKKPKDLSFTIEGTQGCCDDCVIPELPSLMLALTALPAVAFAARYRRAK